MSKEKYCICRYCGKELKHKKSILEHEKRCKQNPNRIICKCRFCGKICERPGALAIHERVCKSNPNRRPLENNGNGWKFANNKRKKIDWNCYYCGEIFNTRRDLEKHKHARHPAESHAAWSKGKTKETDERLRMRSESAKEKYRRGEWVPPNKGKHHSEETKKKISELRKAYLRLHPDKVPYLLNHHRKGPSYPERYFKFILDINKIKFEMDYSCIGYFLDFAFPRAKVYFEVDGDQHYLDKRIVEHDIERTRNLEENGWKCIRRIRWSHFRNLSYEQRKYYISDMIEEIRKALNSES